MAMVRSVLVATAACALFGLVPAVRTVVHVEGPNQQMAAPPSHGQAQQQHQHSTAADTTEDNSWEDEVYGDWEDEVYGDTAKPEGETMKPEDTAKPEDTNKPEEITAVPTPAPTPAPPRHWEERDPRPLIEREDEMGELDAGTPDDALIPQLIPQGSEVLEFSSSSDVDLFNYLQDARFNMFVVDKSGSMDDMDLGCGITRLDFLKKELTKAIKHIKSDRDFNIIAFSSGVTFLSSKPLKATDSNKEFAYNWIRGLRAKGGTDIQKALREAQRFSGVDTIHLLSDGEPSGGCKSASCMQVNVRTHTTLFQPTGRSGLARNILQGIADDTGGKFLDPCEPEKPNFEYKWELSGAQGGQLIDRPLVQLVKSDHSWHHSIYAIDGNGDKIFKIRDTHNAWSLTKRRRSYRIMPVDASGPEDALFTLNKDVFGRGFMGMRHEWRVWRGRERDNNLEFYAVSKAFSWNFKFYRSIEDRDKDVKSAPTWVARAKFYKKTEEKGQHFDLKVKPGIDSGLLLVISSLIDLGRKSAADKGGCKC